LCPPPPLVHLPQATLVEEKLKTYSIIQENQWTKGEM
jgi:hypothetical protein